MLAALGFNLEVAVSRTLNAGYIVVMTVGEFTALAVNRVGINIWWSGLIATAVGGIAAILIYRIVVEPFQRRGVQMFVIVLITASLATLAFALATIIFGSSVFSYSAPRSFDSPVGTILTKEQLFVIVFAVVVVIAVDLITRFTSLGRNIRAIADDDQLARSAGIPVRAVTQLTWFLSGLIGGVAGFFVGLTDVNFSAISNQDYLVLLIAAAFVGGVGKPYGALLGALVIGMTTKFAALWINPALSPLIGFLMLILVIIVRPSGILGGTVTETRA